MPLWKKKKDDDPDLEALLEEGDVSDALDSQEPISARPSDEEDLLDQYLNSDTQTPDSPAPSTDESQSDESQSTESPFVLDLSTEDNDTEAEDDDSKDAADDVMSIFEVEDEEDEDMIALSKSLVDISAEEILTEARTVSRRLARLAEGRVPR